MIIFVTTIVFFTRIKVNLIQRLQKSSHKNKDLIWIEFVIAGDKDFISNGNGLAAIGEFTSPDDTLRPDGIRHYSEEICANHPGHISSEDNHSLF